MATKITSRVIAPGAVTAEALAPGVGAGPVIANVQIANSSYSLLDDTAVALEGGYILINGDNFGQNTQVIIANTNATSVTYISSSLVRAQVPAKSAGSYILYLVNTDTGATAIRVNAVTYSGTPTWITGSTLTEGAVDETISIQLSATSDSNVVYQLLAGSTLPAGLTLSANGLLSGTVTGLNEDTIYNFTIEAVDVENQESPRSFSITITAGDEYINSTVLALNADSNTFITDASTNNFAITPVGDTRPSAFSPYNTSWSNFFDGTGDYLSFTKETTTSSFTCECWFYRGANVSGYHILFSGSNLGNPNPDNVQLIVSNAGGVGLTLSGAGIAQTGTSVLQNAWNHIAWVRSGSSCAIFVNGNRIVTGTSSAPLNVMSIGTYLAGYQPNGYISNVRIVTDAVYDISLTTYTTPTQPLTAISGTSLLTCQSNRLIDNSTNNFAITRNGDVKVTAFAPFVDTDTTTGSGYFDGSGDYLTAVSNAALTTGTGNCTFEAWVYSAISGPIVVDSISNAVTSMYISGGGSGNRAIFAAANYPGSGISIIITTTNSIPANTWTHFALVRNSGIFTVYINGVAGGSASNTNDSYELRAIGSLVQSGIPLANFSGYISNARIVKGTAVYTSNFTPPTSPLTAVSGTSLLTLQNRISYNNSQPIDESGIRNIITRNGNASAGTFSPHVPTGWSAYFDGAGDYLNASYLSSNFGTGDFTLEAWIYNTSRTDYNVILDTRSGATANPFVFGISPSGYLYYFTGTEYSTSAAGTIVSLNVWTHFAISRSGTTIKIFQDGVEKLSRTDSSNLTGTSTTTNTIGRAVQGVGHFFGYISNLRIVKGTAVYTAAFTPSTEPLEPIAGTSLLTLRGPSFADDGPGRFAITRNGDTRITPFSPLKPHTITPDSHSVYFDGAGDYLSSTVTTQSPGTGSFTYECWFYLGSLASTRGIFNTRSGDSTDGFDLAIETNGDIFLSYTNSVLLDAAVNVLPNVWYHLAVVRNGSTNWTVYLNGTSVGTISNNSNFTSTTVLIGSVALAGNPCLGYISNFRYTRSALYTGNFTPSTTPLNNIANTSLLTCQSPTVIDNSNNAFAITVNGNAQPTRFNPFGETVSEGVEYAPASHGGSMSFDGSGDYLVASNVPTDFATSNFTIEFWMYPTVINSSIKAIIDPRTSDASAHPLIWINASNQLYYFTTNANRIVGTTTLTSGRWYHVALVRNNGITTLFLNGAVEGTPWSDATSYVTSTSFFIGQRYTSTAYNYAGYLSGMSVIKGTAVYTSAFVPPAAPPLPVAGTTLLLNGTNAAIADGVGKNVLETVGNARIINGIKKYGTGSMYFDGSEDGLLVKNTSIQSFGTGDFTIECWMNTTATSGTADLFGQLDSGSSTEPVLVRNSTTLFWQTNYGVTNLMSVAASGLFDGNWHHVAMVRYNGVSRVYLDGTSIMNANDTTNYNSVGDIGVGAIGAVYGDYLGYIDDFRITKGVARYTANFTPPTSSFKLK